MPATAATRSRTLILRHDASGDWDLAGLVGPEPGPRTAAKTLH
jgi:hypothetical protein